MSGIKKQQGVALVVSLIMLLLLTMAVVTSFNIGTGNLKIVGNAQDRQRASNEAERLLNDTLNTIQLGLVSDPCNMASLKAGDGSKTTTYNNVEVELERNLVRTQCVKNIDVLKPLNDLTDKLVEAKQDEADKCKTAGSDCDTAKSESAQLVAEKSEALRRAIECTTTPSSTGGATVVPEMTESEFNKNSYCVDVVMELRANAEDVASGARATVMRGIALHCSTHDIPEAKC